jgi:hypothetical protein
MARRSSDSTFAGHTLTGYAEAVKKGLNPNGLKKYTKKELDIHLCTMCSTSFKCKGKQPGLHYCSCLHEPGAWQGRMQLLYWCSLNCMANDLNGTDTEEDTPMDCSSL